MSVCSEADNANQDVGISQVLELVFGGSSHLLSISGLGASYPHTRLFFTSLLYSLEEETAHPSSSCVHASGIESLASNTHAQTILVTLENRGPQRSDRM